MGYHERNTWVQVITTVVMLGIYVPWTLATLPAGATDGPEWLWRMGWVIGATVSVSVVASIAWNLAGGIKRGEANLDERDVRISQAGDRVGQAFLVIAGIVAIIMCATPTLPFWIAHTIFAGFALSALIGGISSLVMYRVGLP